MERSRLYRYPNVWAIALVADPPAAAATVEGAHSVFIVHSRPDVTATLPSPPGAGYFAEHTVQSLATALRAGRVSPGELVDHALRAAAQLAPRFNAFVTIDACGAREAAERATTELASGIDRGPLHGIPVAVKDMVATAGLRTTMGARHFAGHVPARDAECVRRLRAAGAIVVGKTTTHEFAYGATGDRSANGAARNPYRPGHMSGGSSAGSAVAVAAGIVPLAVGTDTGGSVRIPAALCGIVGLRPSHGAVPTDGVFPLSPSLDTVGPMARTVADCRALWHALTSPALATGPPCGPTGPEDGPAPERPRIGWLAPDTMCPTDPAVTAAARARLDDFTADVVDTELPDADGIRRAYSTLQGFEAHAVHAARLAVAADQYDDEVRARLRIGARISEAEYRDARAVQRLARRAADQLLAEHDLLALPTVGVVAPPVGTRSVWAGGQRVEVRDALLGLTLAWSVTGLPALSIPAGLVDGLPVGLQLVARAGGEDLLLRIAERVDAELIEV
jgi:Asp-tRNA(Asn)/Glu-tRNA(Gln) amidotransferase A subunit family amidase